MVKGASATPTPKPSCGDARRLRAPMANVEASRVDPVDVADGGMADTVVEYDLEAVMLVVAR